MPDVREKLVAWLCEAMILFDKRKDEKGINPFAVFADHLIANGVTIQRWIPVTERFPCGLGKELSENVIVRTIDGEVTTGWVNPNGWWLIIRDNDDHTRHNHSYVTHWMPLPEPPKEE